jgi:serine/threonine-protein kinase
MSESNETEKIPRETNLSPNSFSYNQLVGAKIDDKYLVQQLIGVGGMGAVFRARHLFIGNDVALKVISPSVGEDASAAERFLREARAAAMIDHPNAIKVMDFGNANNLFYLVMEYVQGVSLKELILQQKRLSLELTVEILGQTCGALNAAHAKGIVHRDIKPDNIMVKRTDEGNLAVKVLDFGIAKMNTQADIPLTGAGVILGTVQYMSPEQCRGDGVIDWRADIYSLGVVAFEMISGKLPFMSSTLTGLLMKHISEPPPPLQVGDLPVSDGADAAIRRALAKRPEDRHQSANDFFHALKDALEAERRPRPTAGAAELAALDARLGDVRVDQAAETVNVSSAATSSLAPPPSGGFNETAAISSETLAKAHSETVSLPAASPAVEKIEPRKPQKPVTPPPTAGGQRKLAVGVGSLFAVLLFAGGGYWIFGNRRPPAPVAVAPAPVVESRLPAPAGSQTVSPDHPGMTLIQGGWLQMGAEDGYEAEKVHTVYVDSFYLDEHEVTNAEFLKFVEATKYVTEAEKNVDPSAPSVTWKTFAAFATPERLEHPVVGVSWNDAKAYAEWAGKRLPTEAEWEYAARGGTTGKFPWGDAEPTGKANVGKKREESGALAAATPDAVVMPPTTQVKSFEPNGYGLYDMIGNVWEWCADWYDQQYYGVSPERNPPGPATGTSRVQRGASCFTDSRQVRVSMRIGVRPEDVQLDIGFRCAKSKE